MANSAKGVGKLLFQGPSAPRHRPRPCKFGARTWAIGCSSRTSRCGASGRVASSRTPRAGQVGRHVEGPLSPIRPPIPRVRHGSPDRLSSCRGFCRPPRGPLGCHGFCRGRKSIRGCAAGAWPGMCPSGSFPSCVGLRICPGPRMDSSCQPVSSRRSFRSACRPRSCWSCGSGTGARQAESQDLLRAVCMTW